MKVVIIDDDTFWMIPYRTALLRRGLDVLYAATVQDGLHALLDPNVRVVLLDVMMPAQPPYDIEEVEEGLSTGIRVLQDLRNRVISRELNVVLLTNRGVDIVRDRVAAAGFDEDLVRIYAKNETSPVLVGDLVSMLLASD